MIEETETPVEQEEETSKDETFAYSGLVPYSLLSGGRKKTPALLTQTQLAARRATLAGSEKFGFGGAVRRSFVDGTVLGRGLFADSADFASDAVDPDFVVTPQLIEMYASDLSETTQENLLNPTIFQSEFKNFAEFLDAVSDARTAEKTRADIFANVGGFGGFSAMVLANAPETVGLSLLTAALFASPVEGPAGEVAAGGALLARLRKLEKAFDAAVKSNRARVAAKTALTSLAADVPLEILRSRMDRTMGYREFAIAIAASGGLSGTVAGVKPQWFNPEMRAALRKAAEDEALEAIADAAGESGKALSKELGIKARSEAKRLTAVRDLRLKMQKAFEETDRILADEGMDGLRQVAEGLGVKVARELDADQALKETKTALRNRIRGMKSAEGRIQLEQLAKKYNVSITTGNVPRLTAKGLTRFPKKPLAQLRKEVEEAAMRALDAAPPGPMSVKKTMTELKREVKAAGAAKLRDESLALTRGVEDATDNQVRRQVSRNIQDITDESELKGIAGRLGVFDDAARDALGKIKPTRKNPNARIKALKSLIINAEVKKFRSSVKDGAGATVDIDDDILNPFRYKTYGDDLTPEMRARIEARKKGSLKEREDALDKIAGAGEHSQSDLVDMVTRQAGELEEPGIRRYLSKMIDGEVKGENLVSSIFAFLFSPTATRLRATGKAVHKTASLLFFESTGTGGANMVSNTRRLQQVYRLKVVDSARKSYILARKAGVKVDETDIVLKYKQLAAGKITRDALADHEKVFIDGLQDFFDSLRKYGNKNGIFGRELATTPQGYFHRIWKPATISPYLVEGKAPEELISFFEKAILAHPDARTNGMQTVVKFADGSKTKARIAGERILSYMRDSETHRSKKAMDKWVSGNRSELIDKLRKTGMSQSDAENAADDVIGVVTDNMNDPAVSAGRARIHMDETYEGQLLNQNTGQMETVNMMQFTNNNIAEVTGVYAQRLIGAGEMRKSLRAFYQIHRTEFDEADLMKGSDDTPTFEAVKKLLKSQAKSQGNVGEVTHSFIDTAMDLTYRSTLGLPMYTDFASGPKTLRFLTRAQAYGQATLGMKLGMAQYPEFANVVMRTGLRASMQHFRMRDVFDALTVWKKGKEMEPVLNQLATHIGSGFDYELGETILRRLDDLGIDQKTAGTSTFTRGLDSVLDAGRNLSLLNPLGIIPMDTFLRRWAMKSHFQWFVDQAYKANKNGSVDFRTGFWRNSKQRWRELGLDEPMVERINKELLRPEVVKTKPAILGQHKVVSLDLDAMEDIGAYDALILAIRRQSDSAIQRQSVGEMPLWFQTNPLFRTIMQFRIFSFTAKGKQAAAGMLRGDMTEAVNVVGSMGLGTLSYVALTHARAMAIPEYEREAYLEERLSTENLIKSSIVRASYFSVLPMLIDAGTGLVDAVAGTDYGPVFNKDTRTSDTLGLDPVRGSVAWSSGITIADALLGASSVFNPNNPMSKKDWRAIQKASVFGRFPVIDEMIGNTISNANIPETDRSW